jgi:hypothetical protein
MQAPAPPQIRLHWIPVEPSWVIAMGMILLAVLPHQVPLSFRKAVHSHIGLVCLLSIAVWIFTKSPVLGMAMFILIAGIRMAKLIEPFAPQTLIQDKVQKKKVWFGEEVMSEDPHTIQERTDSPGLIRDQVTDQDAKPWFGEEALEEHTTEIQERPVASASPYNSYTDYEQNSLGQHH